MKIKSIKRLPNYIRFGHEVVVEDVPGLEILVHISGSLEICEGFLKGRVIVDVEEWEWEEIKFMGKVVKYKKFEELYGELFDEGFRALEKRVDALAEKEVMKQFPNDITFLDKAKIKATLTCMTKFDRLTVKAKDELAHAGTIIYKGWELGRLASLLGVEPQSFRWSETETGLWEKGYTRGVNQEILDFTLQGF